MEGKKISFGFMKTKKAEKPVEQEKRDYIECLEEKSIKVVGGETVEEEKPLVIPMKPNTLITAERLKEIAEKVESSLEETEKEKEIKVEIKEEPVENETLDQMAVRELLQDSLKEVKAETQELLVPVPTKPVIDGQKESTLDDYEAVPIQDFGLAMLRGMGWAPGDEKAKYKQPALRPKGLGLGADKIVTENQKKKASKESKVEELPIVKNSHVIVTSGKYRGCYGKSTEASPLPAEIAREMHSCTNACTCNEFQKTMEKFFIECVKQHPCLWDNKLPSYKNLEIRDAAWKAIIKRTKLESVSAAKSKWKNLRDIHREALKNIKKKKGKQSPKNRKIWKYMSQMEFLIPYMSSERDTNVGSPIDSSLSAEDSEITVSSDHANTKDSSPVPHKKKKNKMVIDKDDSVSKLLKERQDDQEKQIARDELHTEASSSDTSKELLPCDALKAFFDSMYQSTKQMPENYQRTIKRKLFQSVMEAEDSIAYETNLSQSIEQLY